MLSTLLILIYSLSMLMLAPLIRLLALFSPRLKTQLADRHFSNATLVELARQRSEKSRCILFFCSSAGEFEQARPLIDRLEKRGDSFIHVCFFSRSGLEFIKARHEQISYSLSPLDSVWSWGRFFSAIRPNCTIVMRHELWPAFLTTARSWGSLFLVDASRSEGENQSGLKRFVRSRLLNIFDRIFVVDAEDAAFFKTTYHIVPHKIEIAGDTKYDRVQERALNAASGSNAAKATDTIRAVIENCSPAPNRLILGSAHKPDLEAALIARRQLIRDRQASNWLLIVVPHDVSTAMISWMEGRIAREGIKVERYSELKEKLKKPREARDGTEVLLVDAMGVLAEIYSLGDAALVGGAMHHQIHNVLEPACHGLALAFGPFYKNSKEAQELLDAQAAHVVRNGDELGIWWHQYDKKSEQTQQLRQRTLATTQRLCGASDRVMASITESMSAVTHVR